jgi:hypothetical protein
MSENIFSKKDKDDKKIILREGVKPDAKMAAKPTAPKVSFSLAPFFGAVKEPKSSEVLENKLNEKKIEIKDVKDIKVKNNIKESKIKVKVEPVKKVEVKNNIISNPKILEMDLISDQIEIAFDWKKNLSLLGTFVMITLVLVAEVYLTLFLWQANEINAKTEKLSTESQSINQEVETNKAKASDALVFQNRVEVVAPIFSRHVYWTNFFSYLEKNTLADVFYSGFNGGVDGTYDLKAFVKDYRAIGVQLKTFLTGDKTNTASITNEKINNSGKEVGVTFDLSLSIKNDLFNK